MRRTTSLQAFLLSSTAVCSSVGALSGCAVDSRQVAPLDIGADAGGRVATADSPTLNSRLTPNPDNSDNSQQTPTDQTASPCEVPGCDESVLLEQPGPRTATDEQMAAGNPAEQQPTEPIPGGDAPEQSAPTQCPPDNVCQQFSADDCTPSFTPAAREGEACQCEGQSCRLLAGELCDQPLNCHSGSCRATQAGPSVCCAAVCGAADLCSADGTACVAPKAPLGQQCLQDQDCESNSCTDGVCCNEACQGVCETCAQTGSCRAAFDDNACPIVRCGATDPGCSDTREDIAADRCEARGLCKSLDACGLAPVGLECQTGFCSESGQCQRPTVNCGSPCDTRGVGSGVLCCSIAGTFEFQCADERDCSSPPDLRVVCDEHSDCADGSVCCLTSSPFNSEVLCVPEEQCAPQLGIRASFNQVCGAPGASTSSCPVDQVCTAGPINNHLSDWSFCQ